MDVKDVQLQSARAQRYDERTQIKERSSSVDETEQKRAAPDSLTDYFAASSRDMESDKDKPIRGDSHSSMRSVPDCYALTAFDGQHSDPEIWLAHYEPYVELRQMDEAAKAAGYTLFLRGNAIDWFETLSDEAKRDAS